MARPLLWQGLMGGKILVLLSLFAMTACVVPIPAELSQSGDGGVNGYPIIKDSTEPMPGVLSVNRQGGQKITLTLSDSDRGDKLTVRVFRDYDKGNLLTLFEASVSNDAVNGSEDRQLDISTNGWCIGTTADDTSLHQFDVVVSDRGFDDKNLSTTTPGKQPGPDGKTSTRSWLGRCVTKP